MMGERPRKPNFIIILADDLGYGDLGCYGNPDISTPHIDRLAAEGMRCTDFHASSPVCSPTRAGLLTGRYQQRAGIPGVILADPKHGLRRHGLQTHEVTFAKQLRSAGYATGIAGKWHLGYDRRYNPIHHGFDDFRGFISGNVDYVSHVNMAGEHDWWDGDTLIEEEGYTTHLITEHALRFIDVNKDRPFCLYIAHAAPHSPYQGPGDEPVRPRDGQRGRRRADVEAAYREMIEEEDKGVGAVVERLQHHGLDERTVVLYFSDNGATDVGSNQPLRGRKGTLWEGGHRVPAIFRCPGWIPAGVVCDELITSLDWMPTMLSLAGASVPKDHRLDGTDLVPILEGGSFGERKLYWGFGDLRAMREGSWKLVEGRDGRARLFNLDEDLGERRDLADRHPQRVEAMRAGIRAWEQDVATGATVQPT